MGSGSIDKRQSKMPQCGRRSGWDIPQRHAKCHSCFSDWYFSAIHCCRATKLIQGDPTVTMFSTLFHLLLKTVSSSSPQRPAVPYGLTLWARESRNTKLILRTEGLNHPASITLKPVKNVSLFYSFPDTDSCFCNTCKHSLNTSHVVKYMVYTPNIWA